MTKPKAIPTILVAILTLVSFTNCSAEDSKYAFPEGCVRSGFEFRENDLILNTGSGQALYLFHNISEKDIWLNHPVGKDPGASAGWASNINPGSWSAFAVNKNGFALNCSKMNEDSVEGLSCEKVLSVCEISNPVFKNDNQGSYWVAENKPLKAMLGEVKNRGISW
ncbi:MAG: hypothetical protein RIG61_09245 [Deltaproteobacteria bacterium]